MNRILFWCLFFLFFPCDKLLSGFTAHAKGLRSILPPAHDFHWMAPKKQITMTQTIKFTLWTPPSPTLKPSPGVPHLDFLTEQMAPKWFRCMCQGLGVILNLDTSFCVGFHNHNSPLYFFKKLTPFFHLYYVLCTILNPLQIYIISFFKPPLM